MPTNNYSTRALGAWFLLSALTLSACGGGAGNPSAIAVAPTPTPTPIQTPAPTSIPTPTPTLNFVGKAGFNGDVCSKPALITAFGTPARIVGDGTAGSCTEAALRTAVLAGGKIAFNCGAAEKTITFTSFMQSDKDFDIDGAGKVVLSGGGTTRLFNGWNSKTMTFRNLTIRDGYFNAASPGAGNEQGAGAIHTNFRGGIIADNVKFLNNVSIDAKTGPNKSERNGGAVSTHESPVAIFYNTVFDSNSGHLGSALNNLLTNLDVINSSVLNNRLDQEGFGGAIYSDGALRTYANPNSPNTSSFTSNGTVNVCGSVIDGNTGGYTGALYTCGYANDQTTVDRSVINGNSTGDVTGVANGGGITAQCNGRLLVKNSTISNNSAKGYGGGINVGTPDNPNPLDRFVILNSTITGNRTTMFDSNSGKFIGGVGGGIFSYGKSTTHLLNNVTITNNSSGQGGGILFNDPVNASATNTIIANNISTNPWNMAKNCGAPLLNGSGVIEFPAAAAGTKACALAPLTTDPRLSGVSLADNGGPTLTLMPPVSSSAFGIGTGCEATDQRGLSRGMRCDAGAVFIRTP